MVALTSVFTYFAQIVSEKNALVGTAIQFLETIGRSFTLMRGSGDNDFMVANIACVVNIVNMLADKKTV